MARKDRTTRDAPISYRPPERLREEFAARVDASGLSTNAFITASVFGRDAPRARRVAGPQQKTVARLLAEAARITGRLQAVAPVSAGTPPPLAALLQECRDELAEIRTCLMLALGRDP